MKAFKDVFLIRDDFLKQKEKSKMILMKMPIFLQFIKGNIVVGRLHLNFLFFPLASKRYKRKYNFIFVFVLFG